MGHEKELLWSFMNFYCRWYISLSELLIHCRILDKVNFHCHWCICLSELYSFLCLALVSVWKFCKLHSIPCHERNGVVLCNCPIRKGPVLDKWIEILMLFYLDKLYLICFVYSISLCCIFFQRTWAWSATEDVWSWFFEVPTGTPLEFDQSQPSI